MAKSETTYSNESAEPQTLTLEKLEEALALLRPKPQAQVRFYDLAVKLPIRKTSPLNWTPMS